MSKYVAWTTYHEDPLMRHVTNYSATCVSANVEHDDLGAALVMSEDKIIIVLNGGINQRWKNIELGKYTRADLDRLIADKESPK